MRKHVLIFMCGFFLLFILSIALPSVAFAGERSYINKAVSDDTRFLFIGDSRTVGMMDCIADTCDASCICEVGKGYVWLKEKASRSVRPAVNKSALVVNLGVNDPDNVDRYINFLNEKGSLWQELGYELYFMSVNPVGENRVICQKDVNVFNNAIREGLSADWSFIDTCSVLEKEGFVSPDGLHYNANTYRRIYDLVTSAILKTEEEK